MTTTKRPRLTLECIAAMLAGEVLSEDRISVRRVDCGWIVQLDMAGVSLARSAQRAMVYVRERRRTAAKGADA